MPNRAPAAGVTVITGGWSVAKKKRNIPGTYIGHHLPWRKKKGKKKKEKKKSGAEYGYRNRELWIV